MKRKVIKQGHNTLTITLPTNWVKDCGISSGDEVNLEINGSTLNVKPDNVVSKEKTKIEISDFDVALEKVVYSIYKRGYDEVELFSTDPSLVSKVQKIILQVAIGFEIVSHSKNSCIIKSVVDMHDEEFNPIVRRVFIMLHSMEEGILDAIKDNNSNELKIFRDMEMMNDRYTGFCRRLLNKRGFGDQKNEKLLYCMIETLEAVADEYKFLCDFFLENKGIEKIPGEGRAILKRICVMSKKIETLYYKFDIKDYVEIYKERKLIIKDILSIYLKQKGSSLMFFHHILNVAQFYIDIANYILSMRL